MRELEDDPAVGFGKNRCRIIRPSEIPTAPLPQTAPAVNIPQLKAKVEECETRLNAVKEEERSANLEREKAKNKQSAVTDARTNRRKDEARLDTLKRELGKLEEDANKDFVAILAEETAKLAKSASALVSLTNSVTILAAKVIEADIALSSLAAHHETRLAELEAHQLALKDAEVKASAGVFLGSPIKY